MTRQRWIEISSIIAAFGGLSWIAKIAVIVATDGEVDSEGAAAFFFLIGVAFMLAGSTVIGALLAEDRSRFVFVPALALSPIIFFVSFALLDELAKSLVADRGATYWRDEAGILVTGIAWFALGIGIFKLAHRSHNGAPEARMRRSPGSATVMTP